MVQMLQSEQINEFAVVGIAIRTSNEVASETIPPAWGRFMGEGVLRRIAGRLSDDVYAVYTDFAHPGVDNEGEYTLVIGARVDPEAEVPEGMTRVVVPTSSRVLFPVANGRHDLVGEKWGEIWSRDDLAKTFIADYEHYTPSGEIVISVGVEPA